MMNIIGSLLGLGSKLLDIIDKHVQDKNLKQKLALEIQKEYMKKLSELEKQFLKSQSDIIVSETTGHSWLQRNWRPITMLVFVFIIANNYVLVPYAHSLFDLNLPVLNLPNQVWELIKYGLTGYIGARSVEKIASVAAQTKLAKELVKAKAEDIESKKLPKPKDFNLSIEDDEF
jgi:hypothetical protein